MKCRYCGRETPVLSLLGSLYDRPTIYGHNDNLKCGYCRKPLFYTLEEARAALRKALMASITVKERR